MLSPLASWLSEECCDDKEDLVGVLESYTRELGALCGGLEVQIEDEDLEGVDVGPDTLTSLEEMTDECAALLACIEARDSSKEACDDLVNGFTGIISDQNQEIDQQQRHQEDELPHHEELAHELDSFANELKEFLLCLQAPGTEEIVSDTEAPASSIAADTTSQPEKEEKMQNYTDANKNPNATADPVTVTNTADISDDSGVPVGTSEANPSHKKEVFSDRTKKAITLHVKRLALQKQRRCGAGTRFRMSKANANDTDTEQEHLPGVKIVWSKYQNMSFQQHIMRQKFARRREQQIQEAERRVESARLKGSKPISYRRSKPNRGKLRDQAAQRATYLNQFKPSSVHPVFSSEFEPRYLCAVYLYGLRRLGTTYITFSSLAQFEQRVRARFDIEEIVSIYREVTEVVIPEPALGRCSNLKRHVKRLQRVSNMENVNDGDTLCVTQNAYDDMTILCDWIKRRQRIVHGFQYESHQPPTCVSSSSNEESTPTKPKANSNVGYKPQLWDTNGRSIGVKLQDDI